VQPTTTLYPRLFLPYAVTLILATVLAWWIAISLVTSTLERRLEEQLGHAAEVLAGGNLPLTSNLLSRLEDLLRANVLLLRHDGRFEHHTPFTGAASLQTALAGRLAGTPAAPLVFIRLQVGGTPYLAAVRSNPGGDAAGYKAIAAVTSLADVRAATRRAAWWLGGAAVLGTLLFSWIGHRAARSITVPIQQLARMSERIAAGERAVRVDLHDRGEVGALAESLNTMAERLRAYEAEAAIQSRLAALGEMAARIAHEIRNPLTAIKMQIQLLSEAVCAAEKPRVARVMEEINRLELIVSSTLTMARPQRLETQPLDLAAQVKAVCELFAAPLAHRHITLATDLAPGIICDLDGDRFKQVVFNLLTNAADVLPGGGTIHVGTRRDENQALLQVEDSGPGVAPDQRESLFEGASSGQANRLGIGLRLSRELVKLHGGTISADDSPTLGGARFTVRFPLTAVQE
jgi:two-component system nitrogen regulation sensor histidine kinase NtrY